MIEETGATEEWDLREAENGMVSAQDRQALMLAMRRHAEAQRNMMQKVLVPSFETAVGRLMDTKVSQILAGQSEALKELREVHAAITANNQKVQRLSRRMSALERRVARLEERDRASSEP